MTLFRSASHFFGCLLAVVAFFGITAPAHAVPQLFTFVGPITFSQDCVDGEFVTGCEPGLESGNISYTVLVDLERLGEHVVRNASDGTTMITTVPATFFADNMADPLFNIGGLPERNVTTEEHIGAGMTLHDLYDLTNDTLGGQPLESSSLHDIVGLSGATFTVGAHFQGHQFEFLHSIGSVTQRTKEIDSDLTLTEIHGVPEPGMFLPMSVGLVGLACSLRRARRA